MIWKGDKMAAEVLNYDEVYEKYCDKVKGYIYPKVTNRADAEDLHSAVFIKVYQKFEGNSRLAAMISDVEGRYGVALDDADLEFVNAAGTFDNDAAHRRNKKENDGHKN